MNEWGLDLNYGDGYFLKRPEYMIEALRKEFNLFGTVETITVQIDDVEAGKVYINTIEPELTDGTWSGRYFTDYEINITAEANPGYRFVGWSGDVESTEWMIKVPIKEGGTQIVPLFEKE